MVTAGADEVPPPLLQQLKPGGRMVIPVGPAHSIQYLTLIEKLADGSTRSRQVTPVRFVPFTRGR
jgi:protein-L-isoaspartate(D-aspartate) O-methyltransferase